MRGPFRALHFEPGATKDSHGCSVGSNWDVVRLPAFDETGDCYVTTNGVPASEVGNVLPLTNRGTARMIAVALNEALGKRSHAEWMALLQDCERGEPPPPPRALETCKKCGDKIDGGMSSQLNEGGWDHYHSACSPVWDRMEALPRKRRTPKPKKPAGPLFDEPAP